MTTQKFSFKDSYNTWKFSAIGPGIVLLALAQGSGELIWWPTLIAKYGYWFLGLIIYATFLQYPITYFVGRYTITTGQSIFGGFKEVNRIIAIVLWILFSFSFLWFGSYVTAGGGAIAELTGLPIGWSQKARSLFWGYVTIFIFFIFLFLFKKKYRVIEIIMKGVAGITLIGLVLSIILIPNVGNELIIFLKNLFSPPTSLPNTWNPQDWGILVSAILFMGLGGFWNLFYSYFIRSKQSGMAENRTDEFQDDDIFIIDADNDNNRNMFRKWNKRLIFDSGIGIIGNLFTTLMICLLAYVYLRPLETVPSGWNIAVTQAVLFEGSLGIWGRWLFLIIAAAFLSDTWLTATDTVAKIHADNLKVAFKPLQNINSKKLYYLIVILLTIISCITLPLYPPGTFLLLNGVINASAMVIIIVAVYAVFQGPIRHKCPNYTHIKTFGTVILALIFVLYLALLVLYLLLSK